MVGGVNRAEGEEWDVEREDWSDGKGRWVESFELVVKSDAGVGRW